MIIVGKGHVWFSLLSPELVESSDDLRIVRSDEVHNKKTILTRVKYRNGTMTVIRKSGISNWVGSHGK